LRLLELRQFQLYSGHLAKFAIKGTSWGKNRRRKNATKVARNGHSAGAHDEHGLLGWESLMFKLLKEKR
jgi:hypothetical protein